MLTRSPRLTTAWSFVRRVSAVLSSIVLASYAWQAFDFVEALTNSSEAERGPLLQGFRAGGFIGVVFLVVGVAVCGGLIFHAGLHAGRLESRHAAKAAELGLALEAEDGGLSWGAVAGMAAVAMGAVAFIALIAYAAGGRPA